MQVLSLHQLTPALVLLRDHLQTVHYARVHLHLRPCHCLIRLVAAALPVAVAAALPVAVVAALPVAVVAAALQAAVVAAALRAVFRAAALRAAVVVAPRQESCITVLTSG